MENKTKKVRIHPNPHQTTSGTLVGAVEQGEPSKQLKLGIARPMVRLHRPVHVGGGEFNL